MRNQLIGYLLGALDPQECEQVEAQLAEDRELQNELELLRDGLEPLEQDEQTFQPPAGLAARACLAVAQRVQAASQAARNLGVEGAGSGMRSRLVDWCVAVGIFVAASFLFVPALQYSRVNSQTAGCQRNLQALAVAHDQCSE
ncbi:MAG TPA: hypothetical protein VFE24_08810, partial [Pirellulales bacterium]|nr:hypothetical protein [Pirellulales bacterium]